MSKKQSQRQRPKQMTVNCELQVKNCDIDFGLGPGIIGTRKCVFRERYPGSFTSYLFQIGLDDIKDKMIDELITYKALIKRPPEYVKKAVEERKKKVETGPKPEPGYGILVKSNLHAETGTNND
jgi:hypothetical protein